jgi:hemoglobin-like flavoprotein
MNVILLRDSFNTLKPYAKEIVKHFYKTLFQKHPEARALFHTNMDSQQDKLIQSLVFIVDNVDKADVFTDYLKKMGRRHHENYGTKAEHYAWVAEAFLATLKYFFEETWTPELDQTWTDALLTIAKIMQSYAEDSAPVAKVEATAPVSVAEDFQKHVNRVVQEALMRALRDPKVLEEVKKAANGHAHKLLMQALSDELSNVKKEILPKQAA